MELGEAAPVVRGATATQGSKHPPIDTQRRRTRIVDQHIHAAQLLLAPPRKPLHTLRVCDVQLGIHHALAAVGHPRRRQLRLQLGQCGAPFVLAAGGQHGARAGPLGDEPHNLEPDALVRSRHHAVLH